MGWLVVPFFLGLLKQDINNYQEPAKIWYLFIFVLKKLHLG